MTAPTPSPHHDRSTWRKFRDLPLLGQIGIWCSVAFLAVTGIGIVGVIAAGPQPEAPLAAAPAAEVAVPVTELSATTTTIPATTIPATIAITFMTAEVVDGDTITMSDGSKVRLIGIDAPERGQCGHDEASAVLTQLIAGQNITLVPGARDDVDKYGRLLRYVEANGLDMNLKMIESGRAIARYDGRDGYGVHARQDAYVAADDLTPSINVCAPIPAVPVISSTPATVFYQNCSAVRAAGAAPIRAGDPGWQPKFDGDDDGVGCE
jgi:endonuclease YncB( thermonuclease family)